MTGSPAQQSRTRDFLRSVAAPAESALRAASTRPLKLYAFLNLLEANFWSEVGVGIGYLDPDQELLEFAHRLDPHWEMVASDIGGEPVLRDVMERLFSSPSGDAPVKELVPDPVLHAPFRTMLMLEADLMRGAATTLLSALAFAGPDEWEALMGEDVDAHALAAALGGQARNPTSQAYADYFTILDHLAAFHILHAAPNDGEALLHLKRAVGGMVGWHLNIRDDAIDGRFRLVTAEVTGILLDEFGRAGVDLRRAQVVMSDTLAKLILNWKRLTAHPA